MKKDAKTKRNSPKKSRLFSKTTVLVATAILAIAAITVVSRQNANMTGSSDHERRSPVAKKVDKNLVTVEVAGQKVQVDSQTGQIQELTPEEKQKLAAGLKQMVNKSAEDLTEIHHSDGSVSVDLEGRFQNVTVAKIDEDGNLIQSCVDNPRAAGAFFGIAPQQIKDANESLTQLTPVKPAEK